MIRQSTRYEFTFPAEVMNVMMFDDNELAINDSEDNMIVIQGVKPSELIYTLRNICCARGGLNIEDCNKHVLGELKAFFSELEL